MSTVTASDQASKLRDLAAQGDARNAGWQLPAVAITGGKGGIGKTSLAVNLTVLLARMGLNPLLVDCDLGLANADVLLGMNPATTLYDVVIGGSPLGSAIIRDRRGFGFIPAASGREELTRLGQRQLVGLMKELHRAAAAHDLLVLDTAAGIHREVMVMLRAARVCVCVVTPDPTSITDAYALIKVLEQHSPGRDIRILVNQAGSQEEAVLCFNKLRKVCRTYLDRELTWIGQVPRDRAVTDAVRARMPFVVNAPDCNAAQSLKGTALRLKGEDWKANYNPAR